MILSEAYQRCHTLTREHYENFPVARWLPRRIRPYVSAIYAFARTADDIADEGWGAPGAPSPQARVNALEAYEAQLQAAVNGQSLEPETQWIFLALADTLDQNQLPIQLFSDLLSAFKQDCLQSSYATYRDLLDYCRRSANPIGRLVLLLHGIREETLFAWSDSICSALQLANFWQDVSVDLDKKGRIYIPQEDWATFGLSRATFDEPSASQAFRDCLKFQVERTQKLFDQGRPLARQLPLPLRLEIKLTWHGGVSILKKIGQQDYDTLVKRPKLRKIDLPALILKALFS